MRASIAMAVYNGLPYLSEQLDSLLAQTHPPHRIVASDDRSTDGSWEFLQDFAARARGIPFTLLRNEGPRGYNANFANAFARCEGDVVFPCDQDDVWSPNKIETMCAVLRDNPDAVVAIHDLEICDAALNPIGQRKLMRSHGVHGPMADYNVGMASVVRREFLDICMPPPESFDYDNWFHFCARALDAKVIHHAPLALYRRHGANATQSAPLQSSRRTSVALIRLRHVLRSLRRDGEGRDVRSDAAKFAALRDWLATHREALAGLRLDPQAERAIAAAEARIAFAETRAAIRAAPLGARVVRIAAMLVGGRYRQASGLRSAFKDLIMG